MRGVDTASSDPVRVSQRAFFGRVVATGRNYEGAFSVRRRPFIGTTTMDAISAQISANAARIVVPPVPQSHWQPPVQVPALALAPALVPEPALAPAPAPAPAQAPAQAPARAFRVLDPFAGTCSLLLAAANLGAMVSGSDIDADGLGLSPSPGCVLKLVPASGVGVYGSDGEDDSDCSGSGSRSGSGGRELGETLSRLGGHRSKNARFKRKREDGSSFMQEGGSPVDNFAHYGLSDRLEKVCYVSRLYPTASTKA